MPFLRPQPHRIDARSLAAFRILISLFILHDIYRRLEHGRLSLAWYYSRLPSDPPGRIKRNYFYPPVLDPLDTPHGSPVHKIWFYRGSPQLQIAIFVVTIIIAILFGIGYKCQITSILLWLFMNGIQNRSPHLADGSDLYLRNMLLWCTVCPIGQVWSIDARRRNNAIKKNLVKTKKCDRDNETNLAESMPTATIQKSSGITTRSGTVLTRRQQAANAPNGSSDGGSSRVPKNTKSKALEDRLDGNQYIIQSVGALGCTLQIFLMYYGALYRRFAGKMWMFPNLTAVYYVMNNAFATRQWAADFLRAHPELSRAMTGGAMIAELACPIACLLASCDGKSWRHVPAITLILFHLSLYACMRLFNWQFMSIICCVILLPPNFWNRLSGAASAVSRSSSTTRGQANHATRQPSLGVRAKCVLSCFFLFYMVYNWCGERNWIAKHDGGDIGEFLRYNQNWLMYGPDVSTSSLVTLITGKIQDSQDSNNATDTSKERRIDILKAIRTRDWGSNSEIDHPTYLNMRQETPGDMAARYPSWRWEVSIKDWVKDRVKPRSMTPDRRVKRLGHVLCVAANDVRQGNEERITHIELAFWSMKTVEFGVATIDHRFDRSQNDVLVVLVEC